MSFCELFFVSVILWQSVVSMTLTRHPAILKKLPVMNGTQLRQLFVGSIISETLRFLAEMPPSFATPRRHTPALKGLRNIAQGCRVSYEARRAKEEALASAPLGPSICIGKQTQRAATYNTHQQRLQRVPPHSWRSVSSKNSRSTSLTECHSYPAFSCFTPHPAF